MTESRQDDQRGPQNSVSDLNEMALAIPSMDGREIGMHLRRAAAAVPEGCCIVEVGAWLGAGTAQLAIGANDAASAPRIHVFDRFKATKSEVLKAKKVGVDLKRGQSTLPLVKKNLAGFGARIELNQCSVEDIVWQHGPIGLYVDDAAKVPHTFFHALREFGPSWVPGVTTLILMDYGYWKNFGDDPKRAKELRVQHDFVTAHPDVFTIMDGGPVAGTAAAIIRYDRAFDFSTVPVIPRKRRTIMDRLLGR